MPCKSPKRLLSTRPFRVCFVKWWQRIGSDKAAAAVAKHIPANAASDRGSGAKMRANMKKNISRFLRGDANKASIKKFGTCQVCRN